MQENSRIYIGNGVVAGKGFYCEAVADREEPGPMIIIGDGTSFGHDCIIAAANSVIIGEKVLVSCNVFIADTQHEYRDVRIPIIDQGNTEPRRRVSIGDGSWIGANTVILCASVGKQSVVGANSVVLKDVPDYSVAVGNPARVIKTYDFNKERWVSV